jgi:hypothetical protein
MLTTTAPPEKLSDADAPAHIKFRDPQKLLQDYWATSELYVPHILHSNLHMDLGWKMKLLTVLLLRLPKENRWAYTNWLGLYYRWEGNATMQMPQ